MLWYVLQSIDISASPTSVSACGGSSTLSTTAYFKLFTKNEDNTTSASTNTSETVTASASYSENKSYTSVSGSKITFDKNKAGDCYGADSRDSIATASYTFSGVTKTDTVTITQNANPLGSWYNTTQTTNSISISPASMSFDSAGGTQTYSVTRYYTQYEARQDSCGTVVCTNSYNTSSTVIPSDYDTTGDFECTSSSVSIGVNSGSERSGKLTVSYDGKSDSINLSQGASQAGTSNGEPYDYTYDFSVSVSPWNDLSCDGGTTYATATFTTYWKYDWEETNDAGEVINSGTSSDSSSSNVTNSTTWSTDRGSISSNGTLTYPASTSDGTTKTTVTGIYNGYSDSDYMTQVDCSSGGGEISCMTISYTLTNGAAGTVYFKTTNGTQQGSHEVDATGNQSLCNIAEDTVLVVTCSNTAVTVGGDTTFTYKNGGIANISLTIVGGGGETITNNCASVSVQGRNWTVTLPKAAASDLTYKFYAVNGFYEEGNVNSGLDWEQEVSVSKGSKTGTARSTTSQFATDDSYFISVSPSEDDTYNYSDCSITIDSDWNGSSGDGDDSGTTNCMSYMIGNNTSKSVTIRIYTLNGDYDNSVTLHEDSVTDPYEICDLTDGTKINVSMTSGNGELNMTSFNFKNGEQKVIEVSEITEPTCNMPSGTFAGDYDFRIDFSEAVASDVTVYIDEKDGECNVINSFEVTVSKGKKTGYGYDVLDQNHDDVAAYFEITNVSPSSDDDYYYWGNGCDYDDSGDCEPSQTLTCNPLFLSYDDESHTMTATFDEMVASDVTINFSVKVNNSAIVTDSIKISEGNNSNSKTLSTTQAITSTAGTSVSISSISPSSDSEYEYNCDTDWEIIPSTSQNNPCVTPTISFSTTNTWGATNANSTVSNVEFCDDGVSVTRSHTLNYPSSNMGQYQTFDITFSINNVACEIQTIEASNDTGTETSGGGSLGFTYSDINPDLIILDGGSFTVSGTFIYINGDGLTKNGTYSITIYIQET